MAKMPCIRFVCLIILQMAGLVVSDSRHKHEARQLEDPSVAIQPGSFWHRIYHNSIVVGDYLYIDGGEIVYNVDNVTINEPANSTYSIDLSQSWTNSTVSLTRIDKQIQTYNRPNLWRDPTDSFFYSFNGAISPITRDVIEPPAPALLKFVPSGNSGTWSKLGSSPNSGFSSLVRIVAAGFASGDGAGYAVGGLQSKGTTWASPYGQDGSISTPSPGLVSFNMTSDAWSNSTLIGTGFVSTGSWVDGQLVYVPNIGGQGVLVPLGGATSGLTSISTGSTSLDFQRVYMYDIASSTWYNQSINGDIIPDPRRLLCAVSVQGDNNTHEVFMYGGQSNSDVGSGQIDVDADLALDAVYVLSLPAFTWQKADFTPRQARALHSCNVVGNRQMLVVGGYNTVDGNSVTRADPWPQGLNVFDMSDMVWKDSYDHSASAYVTPTVVKQWYQTNGQYPSNIDSQVQNLFVNQQATNTTSANGTASATALPSTQTSGSNTAAIAGGVVGGVLGLVIIAGLIWFFLRRRKRSGRSELAGSTGWMRSTKDTMMQDMKSPNSLASPGYSSFAGSKKGSVQYPGTEDTLSELHDGHVDRNHVGSYGFGKAELPDNQSRGEMPGSRISMTDPNSGRYELPGDSIRRSQYQA